MGVKYQSIPHPQLGENEARATKFVVLAAGTFGSASILERSGIGSDKVMNKLNIKQLVDLPGVGENYMGMQLFHSFGGSLTKLLFTLGRPYDCLYTIPRSKGYRNDE